MACDTLLVGCGMICAKSAPKKCSEKCSQSVPSGLKKCVMEFPCHGLYSTKALENRHFIKAMPLTARTTSRTDPAARQNRWSAHQQQDAVKTKMLKRSSVQNASFWSTSALGEVTRAVVG